MPLAGPPGASRGLVGDTGSQACDISLLEGVFAVSKPSTVSTPQVLLDLQAIFAKSTTFAPLLADTRRKRAEQEAHQPPNQKRKNEEADGRYFKMGHGGTLDPMASGVLIIGIGRGTKQLSSFLSSRKTYETVVLFGASTDTYDVDGEVVGEAASEHITAELVKSRLGRFTGTFKQSPPIYSALKINGVKACAYVRQGKELPRGLEARDVYVEECELLEFMSVGTRDLLHPHDEDIAALAPAARIRLTVSSGFYVRSFANDLGIACDSLATMASLHRSRQADFATDPPATSDLSPAVSYHDLNAGEDIWGPKVVDELKRWSEKDRAQRGHGHGSRDEIHDRPRQRFRGEWLATTKEERIKQQGEKYKGKYNQLRKPEADVEPSRFASKGDFHHSKPNKTGSDQPIVSSSLPPQSRYSEGEHF